MRVVRTLAALAALALAPFPAHATTFIPGKFVTGSQSVWGDDPAPGNISFLLENEFDSVFAPSGLLEVGIPGAAGFSMIFDGPDPIITYLPASGTPGPLVADLLDPVDTSSGALGGEVVTAALNVIFSDDNLLAHAPGVAFGDLVLQNLESLVGDPELGFGPEIAELDGMPVRDVLSEANPLLGGGASPFTPQEVSSLLQDVNMSFTVGLVTPFAMEHLAFPATAPVPEPSTWAMLVIGFAGLGFVRYRASRNGKEIAGSSGPAQSRG